MVCVSVCMCGSVCDVCVCVWCVSLCGMFVVWGLCIVCGSVYDMCVCVWCGVCV